MGHPRSRTVLGTRDTENKASEGAGAFVVGLTFQQRMWERIWAPWCVRLIKAVLCPCIWSFLSECVIYYLRGFFVFCFFILLESLVFGYMKSFHHPVKHFRYVVEQGEIEKHISPMENQTISQKVMIAGCNSQAFHMGNVLLSFCKVIQLRDAKDGVCIFVVVLGQWGLNLGLPTILCILSLLMDGLCRHLLWCQILGEGSGVNVDRNPQDTPARLDGWLWHRPSRWPATA